MVREINAGQRNDTDLHRYDDSHEEMITIYATLNYFTSVTDIIKLMLCLCAVAVDIFLITTISNVKEMKTTTFTFIKHYSIFNITYMVATPMLWFLLEKASVSAFLDADVYCVIRHAEASFLLFCHLFSFGLALQWMATTYLAALKSRFEWIQRYSVHIIYAVGLVDFVIQNGLCFTVHWRAGHTIGLTVYAAIVIFLGICNYAEHVGGISKDTDASFSLSIANIMIFSWVPLYSYKELFDLAKGTVILRVVLSFTIFIPEWLAYGCPITVAAMFGCVNVPFKAARWSLFKKTCKVYDKNNEKVKDSEIDFSDEKFFKTDDSSTYL